MDVRHEIRYHLDELCFCCGRANPHSMQMRVFSHPAGVTAQARLTRVHEGAHGKAHGGALAALFDELIGSLASHSGTPAVTANLSIDFRAPVPLPATLTFLAPWPKAEGRKLWVSAEARLGNLMVAEARGLWIVRPQSRPAAVPSQLLEEGSETT